MEETKTLEQVQKELEELKSTLVLIFAMLFCIGIGIFLGWGIWAA